MQRKQSNALQAATCITFVGRTQAVTAQHSPTKNRLLAALPLKDYANLLPHLEFVSLPRGSVVYGPGERENYLYFLIEGIVVQFHKTVDGASSESAIKGNEGVIGIASFLGGESIVSRSIMLCTGYAYRVRTEVLTGDLKHVALLHLIRKYIMALIVQIGQTAVCARRHSTEKQLCCLILWSLDRLPSNELMITQEMFSEMLGVRRESITTAAANLKWAGLIKYSRGHIIILDRPRLEEQVCECYAVVKREYDRLLFA